MSPPTPTLGLDATLPHFQTSASVLDTILAPPMDNVLSPPIPPLPYPVTSTLVSSPAPAAIDSLLDAKEMTFFQHIAAGPAQ